MELKSRPALILAPARTWHVGVGNAMWEQAKARADELGSYLLWCDGGEGGVSGVAGPGMHEAVQVGPGSWTRKIGVPWPFDRRRTFFVTGGVFAPFMVIWGLVGAGWAIEEIYLRLVSGETSNEDMFGLLRGARRVGEMVRQWRIRAKPDEERPLLQ